MSGTRQKTLGEQLPQTLAAEGRGEALDAEAEDAEPLMAKPAPESPGLAEHLMEEVCDRGTTISSRSVFPESMRPPKPHSVEPPWYGPVCPVVWEGWRREAPPYPDQGSIWPVRQVVTECSLLAHFCHWIAIAEGPESALLDVARVRAPRVGFCRVGAQVRHADGDALPWSTSPKLPQGRERGDFCPCCETKTPCSRR